MHALLQGFRGYTRGCASAPPRNVTTSRREESPLESTSLCRFLCIPLQKLKGYCRGQPLGSPNNRGNHPFLKNKRSNLQLQITPRMAAAQGKERPMAQITSAAHRTASSGTPRANLCLARGADTAPRNPRPARGHGAPSGGFPPRSRSPSAHGAAPALPIGALKALTCRTPESKGNPRHVSLLTPPGNQISALFDQPALCSHPQRCAGWLVSFLNTLPPTPIPRPHHTPRKRTVAPSKDIWPPTRRQPRTTP
jgi:hypothetical protein